MVETEHPTMTAGSTLRFRVVDPTRGIESSTWSIFGSKKSGDLYFSGRENMSDLKISLHASGMNRIAWTTAVASSRVAPRRALTGFCRGGTPLTCSQTAGLSRQAVHTRLRAIASPATPC